MSGHGIWFLDTLVRVRVAHDAAADGLSVLEHRAPFGDSPPLHIHHTEDELFVVLEGEFRFLIGDELRTGRGGQLILAPKGVPHTYRVDSTSGGRWLTITARGDFERFVQTMGRNADREALPPPSGHPSPEAAEALATTAREFGIELVGPPLPALGDA
ncbi:MAG TPA: cupin domain-containing protein [Limnochordia bacterium]|nr:cupin domain-containing protein [Limnochordia bacterium]